MTEYEKQHEEVNPDVHTHFCMCCGKEETVDLRGEEYWREEDKEKLWHKLNDNIHEYPSRLEHFKFKDVEVCDECYLKWLTSFKCIDKMMN